MIIKYLINLSILYQRISNKLIHKLNLPVDAALLFIRQLSRTDIFYAPTRNCVKNPVWINSYLFLSLIRWRSSLKSSVYLTAYSIWESMLKLNVIFLISNLIFSFVKYHILYKIFPTSIQDEILHYYFRSFPYDLAHWADQPKK